jgi:hypothetical protein
VSYLRAAQGIGTKTKETAEAHDRVSNATGDLLDEQMVDFTNGLIAGAIDLSPFTSSLDISRLSGCAVAFATMADPPSCVCQITGGGWKRSKTGVEGLSTCTAFGAVPIDAAYESV